MRVFLTHISWSNENKSCMRVDNSLQVRFCMIVFLTPMLLSNKNKSSMYVEKREFALRVFSPPMF